MTISPSWTRIRTLVCPTHSTLTILTKLHWSLQFKHALHFFLVNVYLWCVTEQAPEHVILNWVQILIHMRRDDSCFVRYDVAKQLLWNVAVYMSIWHNITEDIMFQHNCYYNLKSHSILYDYLSLLKHVLQLNSQTTLGYNFIWVWHIDINRLVCKIPEPYCSWNNVAFHCVTSWSDWILLSQQSWVVIRRNAGSCPQVEFLNWFGTVKVKTQWPQVIACLMMRGVSKMSQGCHTCNRTAQHPVVKHPAVRYRQVPLMVSRVGQVNSGHDPLPLREV